LLEKNKPNLKKSKIKAKNIKAIIVPHAGYAYSGITAAIGYNAIKEAKPKKVSIFGPAHHDLIIGAKTFQGTWENPLGLVNATPAKDLPIITNDSEHSIEVQIPFLQKALGHFEFTPIIYGDINPEELLKVMESENEKESLIIVSSDLSHYLPYEQAKVVDGITLNSILSLDTNTLSQKGDACGIIGILALCELAKKKKWKPILLDYRNSGDTSGNKKGVVGYASIIFTE
jgi:AmmeMemoRadiSam system protein B